MSRSDTGLAKPLELAVWQISFLAFHLYRSSLTSWCQFSSEIKRACNFPAYTQWLVPKNWCLVPDDYQCQFNRNLSLAQQGECRTSDTPNISAPRPLVSQIVCWRLTSAQPVFNKLCPVKNQHADEISFSSSRSNLNHPLGKI